MMETAYCGACERIRAITETITSRPYGTLGHKPAPAGTVQRSVELSCEHRTTIISRG